MTVTPEMKVVPMAEASEYRHFHLTLPNGQPTVATLPVSGPEADRFIKEYLEAHSSRGVQGVAPGVEIHLDRFLLLGVDSVRLSSGVMYASLPTGDEEVDERSLEHLHSLAVAAGKQIEGEISKKREDGLRKALQKAALELELLGYPVSPDQIDQAYELMQAAMDGDDVHIGAIVQKLISDN